MPHLFWCRYNIYFYSTNKKEREEKKVEEKSKEPQVRLSAFNLSKNIFVSSEIE